MRMKALAGAKARAALAHDRRDGILVLTPEQLDEKEVNGAVTRGQELWDGAHEAYEVQYPACRTPNGNQQTARKLHSVGELQSCHHPDPRTRTNTRKLIDKMRKYMGATWANAFPLWSYPASAGTEWPPVGREKACAGLSAVRRKLSK